MNFRSYTHQGLSKKKKDQPSEAKVVALSSGLTKK